MKNVNILSYEVKDTDELEVYNLHERGLPWEAKPDDDYMLYC